MRILILAAALAVAAGSATAQRHQITINAETPEGQLLQQIGQEADEAKKLALMEKFIAAHSKHEGMAWVLEQMVPAYLKANQFDKAMDTAEKLLALDPQDLEAAHQALKAAEGKKDPAAVIKWAVTTSDAARKVAQAPKPKEADEVEGWKSTVDHAKQLDVYTEYSLYAAALQTADPKTRIQLIDALEQRNPQSQYMPQLANPRFVAYLQVGDNEKAIAVAEKVLEKDQSNEDMLLTVANHYRVVKKDPQRALDLGNKALEVLSAKPKPQGMSDADWTKRKEQLTGRAQWMIGLIHASQGRWTQADQALRAALPGLQDSQAMTAEALFYLGLANFRLGEKECEPERILAAVKFTKEAAAIPGPYQAPARTNLRAFQSKCVIR